MTTHQTTFAPVPLLAGLACVGGACALLLSDAWVSGHWTVNHILQPILIIVAVAAAVASHRALLSLRLGTAACMAVLAVLGSAATLYSTLGRTSTDKADKVAHSVTASRALAIKQQDLQTARETARVECRSGFATRCTAAVKRVDALAAEVGGIQVIAADPRADSIAELAALIAGIDKARVRAIVSAVDPLVLPLTLELGSVLFLASAFPRRRRIATPKVVQQQAPVPCLVETPRVLSSVTLAQTSKAQALADLQDMQRSESGRLLAHRWNLDEGTVSRWLDQWEQEGIIRRARTGKSKAVLALPALENKQGTIGAVR